MKVIGEVLIHLTLTHCSFELMSLFVCFGTDKFVTIMCFS